MMEGTVVVGLGVGVIDTGEGEAVGEGVVIGVVTGVGVGDGVVTGIGVVMGIGDGEGVTGAAETFTETVLGLV